MKSTIYEVLCETSVYRGVVKEHYWLTTLDLMDLDEEQQEYILQALGDRQLVERSIEENYLFFTII